VNKQLSTLFLELENQRTLLINSLREVEREKLNLSKNGKWSVSQILNHIVSAERLSIDYLQKKIQGINEAGHSGIKEELKMLLLIVSQRLPGLKFKAPRAVVEITPSTSDLAVLSKQWEDVRADLKALLEKIPAGQEKKLIYKHVRAGRLNIIHALKFFREHVIHHTPQIKRLL
jgi:uncharacterized damage-inducible protein DinB